jgi:outer membrane protein TolC
MQKMKWGVTLAFALFLGMAPLRGQEGGDTLLVLSLDEYLDWVAQYHPVARQANLLETEARAGLRIARGAFDPKWYADWQRKSFDGKNYFNLGESGVKMPTRIGWELKGAYQAASGVFLNPENSLPARGQAIFGLSVPLVQGMFTDQRRTALAQAKILPQINEAARANLLNDLLMEAIETYWKWGLAYGRQEIARQALEIARVRLDGIRESFLAGDKPAVDTLETFIQLQTRTLERRQAELQFMNATLDLSNFLWTQDETPLQLSPEFIPQDIQSLSASDLPIPEQDNLFQLLVDNHPLLRQYRLKQKQLELDRRLQAEMLKPRIDLEYNFLGDGLNFGAPQEVDNLLFQNYKVGLTAEFPLFLRKERGKLELADLKLLDNQYTLQQKQLELGAKFNSYYNEINNLRDQISLYESVSANYVALLNAESIKFALGESSIFLVNSRENGLIEAQVKLLEIKAKYLSSRYRVLWSAGLLPEQ